MPNQERRRPQVRMVHVRLPEDLHKQLRIRAAESDMTLQDWVAMAIQHEIDRVDGEKVDKSR